MGGRVGTTSPICKIVPRSLRRGGLPGSVGGEQAANTLQRDGSSRHATTANAKVRGAFEAFSLVTRWAMLAFTRQRPQCPPLGRVRRDLAPIMQGRTRTSAGISRTYKVSLLCPLSSGGRRVWNAVRAPAFSRFVMIRPIQSTRRGSGAHCLGAGQGPPGRRQRSGHMTHNERTPGP